MTKLPAAITSLFPNRLIKAALKFRNLLKHATRLGAKEPSLGTMNRIRTEIESAMKDSRCLKETFAGTRPTPIGQEEKIAIRCMMSRFWENSSPFSLDLVGAVIRQGVFIEKMHGIDWIHSPAVQSTMERLINKYDRYFTIIKENPGQVAVPTLDVDLAWRTYPNPSFPSNH